MPNCTHGRGRPSPLLFGGGSRQTDMRSWTCSIPRGCGGRCCSPKLVLRLEWDRDAPPQKALRARAAYRLKPLTAPSRSRTGSKCTAAGLG